MRMAFALLILSGAVVTINALIPSALSAETRDCAASQSSDILLSTIPTHMEPPVLSPISGDPVRSVKLAFPFPTSIKPAPSNTCLSDAKSTSSSTVFGSAVASNCLPANGLILGMIPEHLAASLMFSGAASPCAKAASYVGTWFNSTKIKFFLYCLGVC